MTTKNEQAIQYIATLPINEKISVRGLARELNISDGTAYRAIKEAETLGLVSTIERVGTIRIEKKNRFTPDMLTFGEIVKIIDGEVLGGRQGLDRPLNNFIIGAMQEDDMVRYFTENSLIIVGNRDSVHSLALQNGVAVLITGGFEASPEVIAMANDLDLPLLSTSYDTFSVATIINRSMNDQEIKKEIVTVGDVYTPIDQTVALEATDTVAIFHEKANETGLSRFPVHHNKRLIGVVTAKDLMGRSQNSTIDRAMTRELVTVHEQMSIISVSHKMVWEDIEMIPVVADNLELLGVISRQDVMKAISTIQQQPQVINTYEDEIVQYVEEYPHSIHNEKYDYRLTVQANMINNLGTISYGVLTELISYVANTRVLEETDHNNIIEKIDLHYFSLIQLGNEIQFAVAIFNQTRRSALVEVDVYHENSPAAKAIITCQFIENIN